MASWQQEPLPEEFGRYRILKILGQGGMGVVYLARDTQLEREVALKVPHFDAERGPKLLNRFEHEARAAARIHHPNICPIHDVGEIDGKRYLTMAYIDGVPLGRLLRQGKRVTPRQAAHVIRKVALAVQEAHQCGVVHRDLKPANIMIDRRGEPIVMDFGLARRYRSEDAHLTRVGATMGTPAYMAPEQCRGEREALGPACDVYSLGVILYELLAGKPPFTGEDALAIVSKVLLEEPPPPSARRPDTDRELERICLKAMAKDVANRYPSAAALAADLKTYLRSGATAASGASVMVPILLDDQDAEAEVEAAGSRATKAATKAGPPPMPRKQDADTEVEPAHSRTVPLDRGPLRRQHRLLIWWLVAGGIGVAALAVIVPVVAYLIYWLTDTNGTCRIQLSDPNAAVTVRVDGADVDVNAARGLRLPPGVHELQVFGKDYDPVQKQFTVQRGDNPPLTVPLTLKIASVTISLSEPFAPVEVKIDGKAGYHHGQIVQLAPRQPHVVEVTGPGYEDVRQPFTVEPGANLTMTVHLRRPGQPEVPRVRK
jgi:predicted Ser/Thr protein kinase